MKATNFAPLLWLMLVLVLIPVTLLLLKRSGLVARLGAGAPGGERMLHLRESLVIGPNQRIVAIEVGDGASRRCLLLGVTPQQINTLHTVDALALLPGPSGQDARIDDRPPGGVAAAPRPSFEVMLAKVRAASARKSAGAS